MRSSLRSPEVEQRFAGSVDVASIAEESFLRDLFLEEILSLSMGKEVERMREIMRFRGDKLMGRRPGQLFTDAWLEGWAK